MKKILFILLFYNVAYSFSQHITDDNEFKRDLNENWQLQRVGDTTIIHDVQFPNSIHQVLFQKKLIDDPYYGNNEQKLKWIEESDWVATCTIMDDGVPFPVQLLKFEGLEPYAKVYFNNSFVFESDNTFKKYSFDITKFFNLKGTNTLKIVFESPVRRGKEIQKQNSLTLPVDERVYTRKPQYEYGWDWGPRFVTTGIRKSVSLHYKPADYFSIESYHATTLTQDTKVGVINNTIEIYSNIDQVLVLSYNSSDANDHVKKFSVKKGLNTITVPLTIKEPQLWWPGNSGSHMSYLLNYNFYTKKTYKKRNGRGVYLQHDYAFCKIELVQEKDSIGRSFYFKVNGIPTYAKGFNVIPPDHFTKGDAADAEEEILDQLLWTSSNMVRIWGGGYYFNDEFYRTCLRDGIMVWQDLMFACAMYPGDTAFVQNVREEVTQVVKRLRNYPNIAVFCGNNESDEAWKNWGWQKQFNYSKTDSTKIWNDYLNLFRKEFPAIIQKNAPEMNYVSTSPQIGWGHKESLTQGDCHYWGVWWGKEPIETFEQKIPRFMSEFGIQAMPDIYTLKSVIADSLLNFNSPEFKNHQKHPTGFETLNYYLKEELVIPTNMDDYAFATQILQSYTLKKAIEAQRRNKPRCMGSLIWQLNDTWPVTSWSIFDSHNRKKLAVDAISNSFLNSLITVKEEKDRFDIYIVNDDKDAYDDYLKIYISDFAGNKLMAKDTFIHINANSSTVYQAVFKKDLKDIDLSTVFMYLNLHETGYHNTFHFVKLNRLQLPKLKCRIFIEDHVTDRGLKNDPHPFYEYRIEIKFDSYSPYFKADESFLFPLKNYDYSYFPAYFPNSIMPGQTVTMIVSRKLFSKKEDIEQIILDSFKSLNNLLIDNK